MNVMYKVAIALLDGAALIEQFANNRINRDDVWKLIDRTRTQHQKPTMRCPSCRPADPGGGPTPGLGAGLCRCGVVRR